MTCPCGKDQDYEVCCGPLHRGARKAGSSEELMRSRYAAFVKKEFAYLIATTDPQTRFEINHQGNEEWANTVEFQKLEVLESKDESNKGFVEFKAYYLDKGTPHVHHEKSKFRKNNGEWFFREGKVLST